MGFSIGGLTGSNSSAKKAATVAFERQKEILQNQHQWEMKDLEKAGLNPALTLGDIGSSSGGSVSPAQVNSGGDSVMGLINSAVSAYTAKKNAETGETQGQLNLANAGKAIAETKGIPQQIKNDTIKALASQTQANAQLSQQKTNSAKAQAEIETEKQRKFLLREQELGQKIQNNRATMEEKKEYIRLQRYLQRGNHGGSAGDVNDLVRTIGGKL